MDLKDHQLKLDREKSELDKEVIEFTSILEEAGIEYVIVSGYVAILTGRSRGTEDVDVVIEKGKTDELVEALKEEDYWCINEEIEKMGDLLKEDLSPRIAKEGEVLPNFELFHPEDRYDQEALENSLTVEINSSKLKISPIELQIAYKLYLGSEKDLEDARHLYKAFKGQLNESKIEEHAGKLKVEEKLDELR